MSQERLLKNPDRYQRCRVCGQSDRALVPIWYRDFQDGTVFAYECENGKQCASRMYALDCEGKDLRPRRRA